MFEVHIKDVVFAQAAKYLILVSNGQQTKRSQLCQLQTSIPTFQQPVLLQNLSDLKVKACIATVDRKLTVIGSFTIQPSQFSQNSQYLLSQNYEFTQNVQDKTVCAGRCKIQIKKHSGVENIFDQKGSNVEGKEDDSFQLKSEEEQQDEEYQHQCELRFIIHCGFQFYLNSGFKVQIKWGSKTKQTKIVKDRVYPVWNQMLSLSGIEERQAQISVFDNKNNKLQWLRLHPSKIRIMFPYHLKIVFREQCVGTFPYIYLTVIREDVPKFSILERQIKLKIKHIGTPLNRKHQYLLIYPKQLQQQNAGQLPLFLELNMKNYIEFDQVNKLIEKHQNYEWHHWNLFVPVYNNNSAYETEQSLILLKSMISKSLVCMYCSFEDARLLFQKKLWNDVTVIQKKEMFENNLKKIYYQQDRLILGKSVQLSNLEIVSMDDEKQAISLQEKWKILSHNYILRNKMIETSIENTQNLKKMIKEKGQVLLTLKNTLLQVKKVNVIMVQKERSALVQLKQRKKNRKVVQNYARYPTMQIIATLYEKQAQLQRRKKVNDEMRMRMDTLEYFSEDSQKLDIDIVQNAKQLLIHQQRLKKMHKIKEAIPKQLQLIGRLQKVFEKREMDREMNEMLMKQSQKLNQIKKKKRQNLQNVYNIVKQHNAGPKSLPQQIKHAEMELQKLNATYAKLIS